MLSYVSITGRPLFALKGPKMKAQGNALGSQVSQYEVALKGHKILPKCILRPFRA